MTLYTTKPAQDDLFEALQSLKEQVLRHHVESIWGWHEDWQRQNFLGNWETCETQSIHADHQVVGFMQTLEEADHLILKTLCISPAYQNRGIGSALMRTLQDHAQVRKLPIRLSVYVTNLRAESFYRRLGFLPGNRGRDFQHMSWSPNVDDGGE